MRILHEFFHMEENSWSVYLVCCSDGTLYCGSTNNLEKRIEKHNSGRGAKYTRGRLPVELVSRRDGLTKSDALRLEILVKKQPSSKKVNFLKN